MPENFKPTNAEVRNFHRAGFATRSAKRGANASFYGATDAGEQQILRSRLPGVTGAATVANTAYFLYVGRVARPTTLNYVRAHVTTVAAGSQDGDVAIATTDTAPDGTAKTFTILAGTFNNGNWAALGPVQNSTALNCQVEATQHIWAAISTRMQTTQPVFYGVTLDMGLGEIQTSAGASQIFTPGTVLTGAIPTAAVTNLGPYLIVY